MLPTASLALPLPLPLAASTLAAPPPPDASEDMLRLVMLSSDMYWEQDAHLRFTKIVVRPDAPNEDRIASLEVGLQRWEIAGAQPLDISWEEHRRQLDARQSFRDFRYLMSDGQHPVRYISTTGVAVFDGAGAFAGYRGTSRDITRSRLARRRLRDAEALLRMAAAAGRLGAWSIELPAMNLIWSDEVCAIHDLPAGTTCSPQDALAFYAPEYCARISTAFDACASQGTPFDIEVELVTARQRRVWVRTIGTAQRDQSGNIVVVQGAFQDISESKKAAEITRQLSERLAVTLESITDAFLTMDRDWRFTYLNPQAERLLGRGRTGLLGKICWDEFPPGGRFRREYERAIADNVTVEFEEFSPTVGLWLQVRAYPSAQGLAVSFHDVTARVRAQQEVQQLNADLEERVERRTAELQEATGEMEAFSYSIAHDLRAPLASIAGYCQALDEKESALLSPRGRHFLQRIGAAALQMDAMTEGLLALARLSHACLRKEVFDLSPIAHRLVGDLRQRDPLRQVHVDVMPAIWAEGDQVLLTQVWANLLSNAWKFTGKQPDAWIEIGMNMGPDGEPVYFVKDNGAGFDMAFAAKLFEVFRRLHGVAEFEGTGVGLATVEKIVRLHGGRIWAEAAPDCGAAFYFTLSAGPAKTLPANHLENRNHARSV